jgi:hypothetical protein
MPEDVNSVASVEASEFSEFTKRIVTTSLGLASSHDDIDASQVVRGPASYREQLCLSTLNKRISVAKLTRNDRGEEWGPMSLRHGSARSATARQHRVVLCY